MLDRISDEFPSMEVPTHRRHSSIQCWEFQHTTNGCCITSEPWMLRNRPKIWPCHLWDTYHKISSNSLAPKEDSDSSSSLGTSFQYVRHNKDEHFAIGRHRKTWLLSHALLTGHVFQFFLIRHTHAFVSWSGSLIISRLSTAWSRMFRSQVTKIQTSPDPLFSEP
jgi:hypothetical protein